MSQRSLLLFQYSSPSVPRPSNYISSLNNKSFLPANISSSFKKIHIFKQRYKNYSSIFSTRFSFKKSPSVRDLLRSCQIFSDAPTFKREGANDASFQASQLENFVVHNYPSDPPPRRVCNLSLFSDALCMCSTPRCKWCTRK